MKKEDRTVSPSVLFLERFWRAALIVLLSCSMMAFSGCRQTPTQSDGRDAQSALRAGNKAKGNLPYGPDMQPAIKSGSSATVKSLLDAGVDPNGMDANGDTPLVDAANSLYSSGQHGDLTIIKMLLAAGADAEKPNRFGLYPINLVFGDSKDSDDAVRLLVNAGANVNHVDRTLEDTPLQTALDARQIKAAAFLLSKGADPNLKSPRGKSALFRGARVDDAQISPTIAQQLLKHNAKPIPSECRLIIAMLTRNNDQPALQELAPLQECK